MISEELLCCELAHGSHSMGRSKLHFKDFLKNALSLAYVIYISSVVCYKLDQKRIRENDLLHFDD